MPATAPTREQFILHWGEMSSRWGISRSVAQIYALLYLSEEALDAAGIAERLGLARSNVSTSLRELQAWGIVRVVHHFGDRRDHYEAVADVWDMFVSILEQKKRREIDPTVEMLRACVGPNCSAAANRDDVATQRLRNLLELLESLGTWYEQMRRLSPDAQRRVLRMGNRLTKVLDDARPRRKGR